MSAAKDPPNASIDFKGIGYSKIGHFKEVRTKIRELEELNVELTRGHNELEAIINSITDGLTILDKDLNILFVNRVQRSMFPEVPLVGKKCYSAFYRRDKVCKDCPALQTMETEKILRGETLIREGTLGERHYEWTTSPIKDPFGQIFKIILLLRDITERKEYELNIMQSDRMAAIGLLSAGIAHEINNPLTCIAGFSEGLLKRLKKGIANPETTNLASFRDYLEIINSEVYRCKEIIQNLQKFSRSADEHTILNIDEIINDTLSLIRQHAKDNNIKIKMRNSLATGLNRVAGSESQLKHLFLNLLNSTLESMQGSGEVSITARNNGNVVEIAISNNGSGRHSILDAKRLDLTTSSKNRSGGSLSLSICYSIMRNHKGDIQIKNMDGNETAFVLYFPSAMT